MACGESARRLCRRGEHLCFVPPLRRRIHNWTSCESKRCTFSSPVPMPDVASASRTGVLIGSARASSGSAHSPGSTWRTRGAGTRRSAACRTRTTHPRVPSLRLAARQPRPRRSERFAEPVDPVASHRARVPPYPMLRRLRQEHLPRASCLSERPAPGGGQREQVESIAANVADAPADLSASSCGRSRFVSSTSYARNPRCAAISARAASGLCSSCDFGAVDRREYLRVRDWLNCGRGPSGIARGIVPGSDSLGSSSVVVRRAHCGSFRAPRTRTQARRRTVPQKATVVRWHRRSDLRCCTAGRVASTPVRPLGCLDSARDQSRTRGGTSAPSRRGSKALEVLACRLRPAPRQLSRDLPLILRRELVECMAPLLWLKCGE